MARFEVMSADARGRLFLFPAFAALHVSGDSVARVAYLLSICDIVVRWFFAAGVVGGARGRGFDEVTDGAVAHAAAQRKLRRGNSWGRWGGSASEMTLARAGIVLRF